MPSTSGWLNVDGMECGDYRPEELNLLNASRTAVFIDKAVIIGMSVTLLLFLIAWAVVAHQSTEAKNRSYASVVISQAESLLKDNDPLTAALLIASLEEYEEPPNGVRVAHEIAKKSIPWDIYKHDKAINSVACSVDGTEILIGSEEGALIWKTDRPEPEFLKLEGIPIAGAVFNHSSDGPRIATFSDDKKNQGLGRNNYFRPKRRGGRVRDKNRLV